MTPTCPACRSSFVTPDTTNGGTGRNVCMNCGHRAAVREFYSDVKHGDIVMSHRPSDDGQSTIYRATMFTDRRVQYAPKPAAVLMPDGTLNDMRKLYTQEVIPDPEGYRTDKHTGNLRPAKPYELGHTERPAAPIRQYKDDDE